MVKNVTSKFMLLHDVARVFVVEEDFKDIKIGYGSRYDQRKDFV